MKTKEPKTKKAAKAVKTSEPKTLEVAIAVAEAAASVVPKVATAEVEAPKKISFEESVKKYEEFQTKKKELKAEIALKEKAPKDAASPAVALTITVLQSKLKETIEAEQTGFKG